MIDSKVVRDGTRWVRVCAAEGTALAIGSYHVPFCPDCTPDTRALYCRVCGNPLFVTSRGRPFCPTCKRTPESPDTYFRSA